MESLIAIYQLTILYMLKRADEEIPMTMVSDFLLEYGYVNFESLFSTYEELRSNGYVDMRSVGDRTFLAITQEGEEALGFFRKQIPPYTVKQVDRYLKENGKRLLSERNVTGEYYKAEYGGYLVHMRIREEKTILFEVNLNVPSENVARSVLAAWEKRSEKVYQAVIGKLFEPDEKDDRAAEKKKEPLKKRENVMDAPEETAEDPSEMTAEDTKEKGTEERERHPGETTGENSGQKKAKS